MMALTIHEPWASAIVYGHKRVENRSWINRNMIGERFAIHTSMYYTVADSQAAPFVAERLRFHVHHADPSLRYWNEAMEAMVDAARGVRQPKFHRSAVIGVATVSEWIGGPHRAIEIGQRDWFKGPNAAVLDDVRPVYPPVRISGRQRFWKLPVDLVALINERTKEPISWT